MTSFLWEMMKIAVMAVCAGVFLPCAMAGDFVAWRLLSNHGGRVHFRWRTALAVASLLFVACMMMTWHFCLWYASVRAANLIEHNPEKPLWSAVIVIEDVSMIDAGGAIFWGFTAIIAGCSTCLVRCAQFLTLLPFPAVFACLMVCCVLLLG